jgi:AcrR family transcriptional regulator
MVRRTPPNRVRDVAQAARSVFIEKGYRRALMTDVGARLGLSHAVLYRYVASKEALFELAMRYSMDPGIISTLEIPLPTPAPGRTLDALRKWARLSAKFPVLAAALARPEPTDIFQEFVAIIDERYAFVSANRQLLALIERSALDLPDLHDLFFRKIRRQDIKRLSDYLDMRISSGALRPASSIDLAARFVMESIAWFAWHRHADADPPAIEDDQAKDAVRELLVAAFVPESALDSTGDELPVAAGANEEIHDRDGSAAMAAAEPLVPSPPVTATPGM